MADDQKKSGNSIFRDGLFTDKVIVVTGGGTGIGLAIAEELTQLGAKVAIASRKMSRLMTAAQGLSHDYNTDVFPVVCDIRKRESIEAMFDAVVEHFGPVDFVVSNGGGQFASPAESISESGWKAVIDTNLNGNWNLYKVAAEKGMYDRGGRIVTIVADFWRGFPLMAHTGASRAGVENLTKTLAVEWAHHKIKLNCVAPGSIVSTGFHNYPPGLMDDTWKLNPSMRFGTCEEIAAAVLFLLSPMADFITGETIKVDGGSNLWGDAWPVPEPKEKPEVNIPPWPEDRWPQFAPKEDES